MAIIAFLASSAFGLFVAVCGMLLLNIGFAMAFGLYMGIGLMLPMLAMTWGHSERRALQSALAPQFSNLRG